MRFLFFILFCSKCYTTIAQDKITSFIQVDSTNFKKLNPYALRGEMDAVFEILEVADDNSLTEKQLIKKKNYYKRFLYRAENYNYNTSDPQIIDILNRFQNYWRSIIIEKVDQKLADSLFRGEMNFFLKKHYKPKFSLDEIDQDYYSLFKSYFKDKGMHGFAMAKTGHLYDLYLWKNEDEIVYDIVLPEGSTEKVPVVFMKNFISYGWSHYTTFGQSFSGGWVTPTKLFCVEETYDKNSEKFKISYVSHEGQHFLDKKIFPKLKQTDLEFRAKLAELSLAKKTINNLIKNFIIYSKNDTSDAHSFANYMVIKLLAKEVFDSEFESDIEKWKQIPHVRINEISLRLLKEHSSNLKALGAKSIEEYITKF
nr:hypothetical protein [uncultured Psychroserpens sp.]